MSEISTDDSNNSEKGTGEHELPSIEQQFTQVVSPPPSSRGSPIDETYTPKALKVQTEPGIVRNISTREFSRQISYESKQKPNVLSGTGRANESRVLVLYTGGTIGMKSVDGVYCPVPNFLLKAIQDIPHLNDKEYTKANYANAQLPPYCLPPVRKVDRRIVYWVLEYEPLLDSSDMTYDDWIKIAKDIYKAYPIYDGFVVLHGTDTLAYTACALSFMFENLGKPVVVTGAQIPIPEVRSDGRENLIGALIMAGNYDIPEVTVYFNNKLMRGNRCVKLDNSALNAFQSPNMDPLAEMEIDIKVDWDSVFRSSEPEKFHVHTNLNRRVGVLRIFPSIPIEAIKAFLSQSMEGVVLQTFGAGNMPSKRKDIIKELNDANERGLIIVNCSQCVKGQVSIHYFTGKILYECGVIGGSDMTAEAALCKLSYVLGKENWSLAEKRKAMRKNLRGELTLPIRQYQTALPDFEILPRLVKFLRISSSEETKLLKAALFPPLVCHAANNKDIEMLEQLKESGAQLTAADYDKRTALHVAASAGNIQVVQYLLRYGASVHARDRWDDTPLLSAIRGNHLEMIKLLKVTGAFISLNPIAVGIELCLSASKNDVKKIECWYVAGADLNTPDYTGKTALHVASASGNFEVVEYLVNHGADLKQKDKFGSTAIDDAKSNNQSREVEFLNSLSNVGPIAAV